MYFYGSIIGEFNENIHQPVGIASSAGIMYDGIIYIFGGRTYGKLINVEKDIMADKWNCYDDKILNTSY